MHPQTSNNIMRTKSIKQNKINVVTLGCSKNVYDSEVLMGQLKASGKEVVHEDKGNIVVINTCGFINNAKEESINTILEYIQKKEEGLVDKVFVMGCLSERYKPDLQKEIPDVDQYFGTTELPALLKVLGADYKHELIGERLTTTPKNYAYLKVSEGCDRPCSFCAIPLMRGSHKSTSIENLVVEAEKLAKKGVKELILIAQDVTYYGLDLYGERKLADLLRALVKVEGIEWIRIHYAFPTGFPKDVLTVMKEEPKICKYLDIPLQHIADPILKSMKRGTTQAKTTQLLKDFREAMPEIAIRTTLIVGYELEDNIPEEEKQRRASEIMEIQSQISWELNQAKVGKTFRCLIDRKEGQYFVGRTEYDSPDVDNEVLIDAAKHYVKIGDFADILITEATDFDLYGTPVKSE